MENPVGYPLQECPKCGHDEFYVKQSFKGTCDFIQRFDGEDVDNGHMHDNTRYRYISKYAYCNKCNKKLFEIAGAN